MFLKAFILSEFFLAFKPEELNVSIPLRREKNHCFSPHNFKKTSLNQLLKQLPKGEGIMRIFLTFCVNHYVK